MDSSYIYYYYNIESKSVTTEITSTTESISTTVSTNEKGEVVKSSSRSFEDKSSKTISGNGKGVVHNKEITDQSTEDNYDLSNNKQAEAFTNNVVDQIQANPEWNLWNESVSLPGVAETSIGIGVAEQFIDVSKKITARTLAPVAGEYIGNKYRNNADHSGKSITYKVAKDGTLSKMIN